MSQDPNIFSSYDAVAAELCAYREQQRQKWGSLDHALLGRYLAGEVSPAERTQVEAELNAHPDLQLLTEVVSGVLDEFQAPAGTPVQEPAVLSFSSARPQRSRQRGRLQRLGALAAAAGLLLALGIALNQPGEVPAPPAPAPVSTVIADGALAGPMRTPIPLALDSKPHAFFGDPTELLAKATEAELFINRREPTKAAEVLFRTTPAPIPVPAPPPGGARSGPRTPAVKGDARRYIQSVARVTNQLLEEQTLERKVVPVAGTPTRDVPPDWLLKNSIRPLMAGVEQNEDPQLRTECAATLARVVTQNGSTEEQLDMVNVLKNVGPEGRAAVPYLEELASRGCDRVKPRAREALHFVRPDWIGLRDSARVLSESARQRINHRLHHLSLEMHTPIVAETVRHPELKSIAAARGQQAQLFTERALQRSKQIGADQVLFFYICVDPPAVEVRLGHPLQQRTAQNWKADAVCDKLRKSVQDQKLDRGLLEAAESIRSIIAK